MPPSPRLRGDLKAAHRNGTLMTLLALCDDKIEASTFGCDKTEASPIFPNPENSRRVSGHEVERGPRSAQRHPRGVAVTHRRQRGAKRGHLITRHQEVHRAEHGLARAR